MWTALFISMNGNVLNLCWMWDKANCTRSNRFYSVNSGSTFERYFRTLARLIARCSADFDILQANAILRIVWRWCSGTFFICSEIHSFDIGGRPDLPLYFFRIASNSVTPSPRLVTRFYNRFTALKLTLYFSAAFTYVFRFSFPFSKCADK